MAVVMKTPSPSVPAKENADADTFRKGMRRHDTKDQQCLGRIGAVEFGHINLAGTRQQPVGEDDRHEADQHPCQREDDIEGDAFRDQAVARSQHQAGGSGIRPADGPLAELLHEKKRKRTDACHDRRDEGRGNHDQQRYFHE